jgi:hypothetical protein
MKTQTAPRAQVPVRVTVATLNGCRVPAVSSRDVYNYLYGRRERGGIDFLLSLDAAKEIAQGEDGPRARELYDYLAAQAVTVQ